MSFWTRCFQDTAPPPRRATGLRRRHLPVLLEGTRAHTQTLKTGEIARPPRLHCALNLSLKLVLWPAPHTGLNGKTLFLATTFPRVNPEPSFWRDPGTVWTNVFTGVETDTTSGAATLYCLQLAIAQHRTLHHTSATPVPGPGMLGAAKARWMRRALAPDSKFGLRRKIVRPSAMLGEWRYSPAQHFVTIALW